MVQWSEELGERGMRDSQRFHRISYLLEEIFKTYAKLRRVKERARKDANKQGPGDKMSI